jgi:uncharacterized membrane protein YeaQ/YmgE (transglycosylase-associated protein family)
MRMGRAKRDGLTQRARISRPRASRAFSQENRMGLMSLIGMIIVGFVVGVLARWFYPGTIAMGFWATTIVGVIGSLVGGVIGGLLWKRPDGRFHPGGWVMSIVGALVVLWVYLNYFVKT